MKKSILFFLLIGMTLLNSCETQEIVLTEQNNSNPIYNSVISSYLTNFKTSVSNNKESTKKISALIDAIDYSSIKQYDLKNTIELVVVDLKNFSVFPEADQTKAIFFVLNNSIIRSNIVTIKNKLPFENPDQVIVSIFDKNENKDNYSGKIEFYNLFQNILLSDEFDNGVLTKNSIALPNTKNTKTNRTSSCDDWYWLTTYSDGSQTAVYLYTTCDPCSGGGGELFKNSDCDSGSGGGGSAYSSNGQPNYPPNPNDTDTITYTNKEGELITEKYDAKNKRWKFYKIELNEVIVTNNKNNRYDHLKLLSQYVRKSIIFEEIIYKFDLASGSWEGEEATKENIAKAIEDQIDDSKLDPCLKAIMDKLKNTTNNGIAEILTKLGANSIYEVNMKLGTTPTYAGTKRIDKYNYEITIDDSKYTSSTNLFKATSILHELIHAYFFSIIDDYNSTPSSNPFNNFPELFQAFVNKNYPGGDNKYVFAQHNQMANLYVGAIASALQQYDGNYLTPYQVYEDMAWGSLQEAPIFDSKFPLGSADRMRIFNRYASESRGAQTGNQYPTGKKCN